MNIERDLRDALQPLGGDPVDDARRVLASLGERGTARAPRLLRRHWLVAAALLLGIGGGFGWASLARGARELAPEPVVGEPARGGELQFVALGIVFVDEPGVGGQKVPPGSYRARAGSTLTVGSGLVGALGPANGARVRLDTEAVATLSPDAVTLRAGRAWVAAAQKAPPVRIDAGLATVELDAGSAVVVRRADSVWLACLGGTAVAHAGGAAVRLSAMQQVELTGAGAGAADKLAFAGSAVGWMVPLLELEFDSTELHAHAAAMIAAYLDPDHRDEAEYELRRLGAHAVPGLHKALAMVAGDRTLLVRTVGLIADLAEFAQGAWLLDLLEHDDEEVRTLAASAFARVTGFAVEPEGFWRVAPRAERGAAVRRWRAVLR